MLEKKQIKKEVTEEEKRLDIMMELDRLNAIQIQEEIEKKRAEEQREYAFCRLETQGLKQNF